MLPVRYQMNLRPTEVFWFDLHSILHYLYWLTQAVMINKYVGKWLVRSWSPLNSLFLLLMRSQLVDYAVNIENIITRQNQGESLHTYLVVDLKAIDLV